MNSNLEDLLEYIKKDGSSSIRSKIAKIIIKYSINKKAIALANTIIGEAIDIDITEMKSLVNPEDIDFPKYEVGVIGVESEESF